MPIDRVLTQLLQDTPLMPIYTSCPLVSQAANQSAVSQSIGSYCSLKYDGAHLPLPCDDCNVSCPMQHEQKIGGATHSGTGAVHSLFEESLGPQLLQPTMSASPSSIATEYSWPPDRNISVCSRGADLRDNVLGLCSAECRVECWCIDTLEDERCWRSQQLASIRSAPRNALHISSCND